VLDRAPSTISRELKRNACVFQAIVDGCFRRS